MRRRSKGETGNGPGREPGVEKEAALRSVPRAYARGYWNLRAPRIGLAFIALVAGGLLWAEVKTTDPMTLQVREIGKSLKCQCGCAYTVADCNMLYCHFRDPINQDIEEGLKAGLTAEAILSKIYAKYGEFVRTEPVAVGFGALGWVMPFAALALGLAIAPIVVRRWKRKSEATETAKPAKNDPPPAAIRRMEEQIEQDLADEE